MAYQKDKAVGVHKAVDVDTLGIDWNRAKQTASELRQDKLTNADLDDLEGDLTGILKSEAFREAVQREAAKRAR